jgi:hypothetical protein
MATVRLRAVRQCVPWRGDKRAFRVALLGEIFHPAIEKCRHAHALLKHCFRGWKRTEVFPETLARMAMGGFGDVRIAIDAEPCRWRRAARLLIGHAIRQMKLDRVRMAFDNVETNVEAVVDRGDVGARLQILGANKRVRRW